MNFARGLFSVVVVPLLFSWLYGAVPADESGANSNKPQTEKVELFQAMKDGSLDVTFIAKDDSEARVIIRNKTKRPLSIKLPEAFAGVPVLAQGGFGVGGVGGRGIGGGGRGGFGGGGGQGLGGGFGGGGRGGIGGGGGGFFNVPPEKVAKLTVPCVCLDHGKPDPTPRMKYEIKPIEEYVKRPEVIELIKGFATGRLDHGAVQAAVWHLNNDVSWKELAAKRHGPKSLLGQRPPYFTDNQMRQAMTFAQQAVLQAEASKSESANTSGEQYPPGYTPGGALPN